MNYFAASNAFLYFCAAGYSWWDGRPWWGAMWATYAIGALFLVMIESGKA